MKNVRARPRRIPAFGEWNYYDHGGYGYGYAGGGDWPVTQYFESAMQAGGGMVIALPASPPKPAKKAVTWSSATMEMADEEEQRRQRQKVVVGMQEQHATKKKTGAGAPTMSSAKYQTTRRAVKAVDEDLYVIPPDMLCHKPRKRLPKSLWIGGCLGRLSCVA